MGDSYSNNQSNGSDFQNQRQNGRNNFRGGRGGNHRESGFRIRLSDNEMRAAKTLQEAFNLRSTVAVLGFAIRTLAQMLEDGNLENLVKEYNSQAPLRNSRRAREDREEGFNDTKPNPFARPEKPVKTEEPETPVTSDEIATPSIESDQSEKNQISNETASDEINSAKSSELG